MRRSSLSTTSRPAETPVLRAARGERRPGSIVSTLEQVQPHPGAREQRVDRQRSVERGCRLRCAAGLEERLAVTAERIGGAGERLRVETEQRDDGVASSRGAAFIAPRTMACGLTDPVWTIEDLLTMMDPRQPLP